MPDLPITPLHRADGPGSSYIFTQYLSKVGRGAGGVSSVSSEFRPSAPVARSASGAQELADLARRTTGAIAYRSFAVAVQSGLAMVSMHNAWKQTVVPSMDAFAYTGSIVEWERTTIEDDPTFEVAMIDQAGPRTWPIMGATYAIIPTRGLPVEQIRSALRFVSWCYDSGDATLVLNGFQPLPELLKRRIRFTWRTVFVDARRKPLL
ncbi:MAG: substrate-binding domain-containing protein [Burkholderiales bacterium]|nr:substrate-binding domain-containing protein [Burkholderiales bacterium]